MAQVDTRQSCTYAVQVETPANGTNPHDHLARILFVDDEESLRFTVPKILEQAGYEVIACATVEEALRCINTRHFDILLSDLNISSEGDGFAIVSAMHQIQPEAINMIFTGYPGLESTLLAIKEHVDDYIIKPAQIPEILGLLELRLRERKQRRMGRKKQLGQILRDNSQELIQSWLKIVMVTQELVDVLVTREQRVEYLPGLLSELAERLELHPNITTSEQTQAARNHGTSRYRQGFSVPNLVEEASILQKAFFLTIHKHLLELDFTNVMLDLAHVTDSLDNQLKQAINAWEQEDEVQIPQTVVTKVVLA